MKQILVLVVVLLMAGCARKVHVEKHFTTAIKDSSWQTLDTSKMVVAAKITEVTNYGGDSLLGSLYFSGTDSNTAIVFDSLESNGIKVKVNLLPQKGGGFKAHVQANAKPKSTLKTTEVNASELRGMVTDGQVKSDTTTKDKSKDTQSEGIPWGWIIAAVGVLTCALYLIEKYV